MAKWLFILLLPLSLFASWTIGEQLERAQAGSYVVYESARFNTLLYVTAHENNRLQIDEITVAESFVKAEPHFDFHVWKKEGAPNHSGWMCYTIDLTTHSVVHAYSRLKHTTVTASDCSLLNILLKTPFHEENGLFVGAWPADHSPLSGAAIWVTTQPENPFPKSIEIRPLKGRRWLYRSVRLSTIIPYSRKASYLPSIIVIQPINNQ